METFCEQKGEDPLLSAAALRIVARLQNQENFGATSTGKPDQISQESPVCAKT
jgi:hypothetical protein